jgi:hypothetical protein
MSRWEMAASPGELVFDRMNKMSRMKNPGIYGTTKYTPPRNQSCDAKDRTGNFRVSSCRLLQRTGDTFYEYRECKKETNGKMSFYWGF